MASIPSAKQNRDFADELIDAARAELARQAELQRQLEQQLQQTNDREKATRLRAQIDAIKGNGREDNGERLRELGREHNERAGTGGRAI